MSSIRILQPHEAQRWEEFVAAHELGTIYHTWSWREVIKQAYGHEPVYLILEAGAGNIIAGLPLFHVKSRLAGNRLVCVPGAQACDPLVSQQGEYDQLVAFALRLMPQRSVDSIEIKTSARFRFDSAKFGRKQPGYSCYVLDLDREWREIENGLQKDSIRRKIKKAAQSGLQAVKENSLAGLAAFYGLFLRLRKSYGLLPQPYKFFTALWRHMSARESIDLVQIKYQDRIISAGLFLKYKDAVVCEYTATRFDLMHLGPSPLLLWEGIRQAKQAGYKCFDFGRTADDNDSLSHFKSKWGTRREPLHYYFIPDFGGAAAMRRQGFSKRAMACAMHHSPTPVCRLMGRMLYKYFV